jgi:hypothetical protein
VIDIIAILKKNSQAWILSLCSAIENCFLDHLEIRVEVRFEDRIPREFPPHSGFEFLDVRERSAGYQSKSGVAGVKVAEAEGEIVGHERAPCAAFLVFGCKHEVVQDELLATLKEICEVNLAVRSVEVIFFAKLHHWEVAKLGI